MNRIAPTARRRCLFAAGAWLAAVRLPAAAPVRRVGYLISGTPGSAEHLSAALVEGLRERGWIEGKNLVLDRRWTENQPPRIPALVQELLAAGPDVMVTTNDVYAQAIARATKTVPIVFAVGFDPVGLDVVQSLARPGGNVTGLSVLADELNAKRLGLLKNLLPQMRRVAVLHQADDPRVEAALASIRRAGEAVGVAVEPLPARRREDLAPAIMLAARTGASALMNVPNPLFFHERCLIAETSIEHGLAAVFGATEFADAGMLFAYSADFATMFRRAGHLVDRILRGAAPADIPVEQANVFEFVLNLKTARALGIAVPAAVRLEATRAIEQLSPPAPPPCGAARRRAAG